MDVPLKPFEWDKSQIITSLPIIRVPSKAIRDILTYEVSIKKDNGFYLLCDAKTAILIKVNNEHIIKRSFLSYQDDENICEYTLNLKHENIKYELTNKKIIYPDYLKEDKEMVDYIKTAINKITNTDELKYLYFLYFNNVSNYSKKKLLNAISIDSTENMSKIYTFLIQNIQIKD